MIRFALLPLVALLSLGGSGSSATETSRKLLRRTQVEASIAWSIDVNSPCDESFPLAIPEDLSTDEFLERRTLMSIPDVRFLLPSDPLQKFHAPLCPDGRRLDTRRLLDCPGAQCFAEMYQMCMHITSQECFAQARGDVPTGKPTERPTPSPTPKPTFGKEITVQPVKVIMKNVKEGYLLNQDVRALIMRSSAEILEKHLDAEGPIELIEVESGGFLDRRELMILDDVESSRDRMLLNSEEALQLMEELMVSNDKGGDNSDTRSLQTWTMEDIDFRASEEEEGDVPVALNVRVAHPKHMTDYALAYIIETLDDHKSAIENTLRDFDDEYLRDVEVVISSFQIGEVVDETEQPTKQPTPRPTPQPVELRKRETVHPVAIFMRDVPSGYRLSPEARSSLLILVHEMMQDELDENFELVEVTYPGRLRHDEGKKTHALPLLIRVRASPDVSDFALALVMEVFEGDNMGRICRHLRSLSPGTFAVCSLGAQTYDLADILGPSMAPTRAPDMITMDHPVQLIFDGVPLGYTFSSRHRQALLKLVEEMVKRRLSDSLELVGVRYAGVLLSNRPGKGNRYSPQFPMMVTIRGPRDDVEAFTVVLMVEAVRDGKGEIEDFLVSIDSDGKFKKPGLSVSDFDPDDLVDTSRIDRIEQTQHGVELTFEGAPPGYAMPPEDEETCRVIVEEILDENMGGLFDLVDVSQYDEASDMITVSVNGGRSLQSGEDSVSVPLLITVEGPDDQSELALPYIMQVIRDNVRDLEDFLRSLNFRDPSVGVDEYWGEPYVPASLEEDGDPMWPLPWWVWLLVALGVLILFACCCLCFRWYTMYRDAVREKEIREDERMSARHLVVEKPVIIEKPVLMNNLVKEKKHKKKKKKHKKKRKQRIIQLEQPQVLQIEQAQPQVLQIEAPQPQVYQIQQPEYQGPTIDVHHVHPDEMTARSGVTFQYDPPSEHYSYFDGHEAYHGRLLGQSVASGAAPLALPAPGAEYMAIADEPSAQYSNYSVVDPSQAGGDLDMLYDQDGRSRQPSRQTSRRSKQQPSGSGWEEVTSGSIHPRKEPSGYEPVDAHSIGTHSNSYVTQPHTSFSQQIRGDMSYTTQQPSHEAGQHPQMRAAASSASSRVSHSTAASSVLPMSRAEYSTAASSGVLPMSSDHRFQPQLSNVNEMQQSETEGSGDMFATFADPSYSVEDRSSGLSSFERDGGGRPVSRRGSAGVESMDGSRGYGYGYNTTSTSL